MTKFLLIRHALTDMIGNRICGRMPGVFLNAAGREQLTRLSAAVANYGVDAVYSSPLERTMETAAVIADRLGLTPTACPEFVELEYGEWTDCTIESIKEQPAFKYYNSFRSGMRIPGGELMLEAQARMIAGIEKLSQEHTGKTIAIVSHGDLIKGAVAYYAGIPLDLLHRLEISPASISIIEIYPETARVVLVNDTGLFSRQHF